MSDLTVRSSFPDTRWTLIQRARGNDLETSQALEEWCRGYWRPVQSYIRSQGKNDDEANELTQSFFERLLSRGAESSLPDELTGAFRAYLMRSVKHFLTDQWRSGQRQRRGAGATHLPVEELSSIKDPTTIPDEAFDQNWALTVMEIALKNLQQEMEEKGKGEFFNAVVGLLDDRQVGEENRTKLAASLGMKDGVFRVSLHRLRGRFRSLIEDEIRQSVSSEEEFHEEVRYLFQVWS